MSSLLEIDSVIKSYATRQVLTDIWLSCLTGDIIGILGRNGCGKSTLLKILFGSLEAERKFIRIDGKVRDCPFETPGLISFLPQDNFLPKYLKISKIITLFLGKDKVNDFLNDPLLESLSGHRISDLSAGELRYFEIKLLLLSNSKFVILDEPFTGLSPLLIDRIKEMIISASLNKGIILTDHDYRNVLELANRYCILFDGGIRQINTKEDLVKWGYLTETRL